jgi:hypothetical protein
MIIIIQINSSEAERFLKGLAAASLLAKIAYEIILLLQNWVV